MLRPTFGHVRRRRGFVPDHLGANQFGLLLIAAAYVLRQKLRRCTARTACVRTQVRRLRERLFKLGLHVVRSVRRVVVHLPRAPPYLDACRCIVLALGATAG